MKMYEIAQGIKKVEDLAEDSKELAQYLDGIEMQLQEKTENVLKFERHLEAQADAIDTEIKRLQALKKSYDNKAINIKNYMQFAMESNNIKKIETPVGNLSLRKTSSVEITDESLLKKEFIVTKTTERPDKKAIKEALKNGQDVGGGAVIKEYKTLLVK